MPLQLLGKGRSYRALNMTKDGCTLLAMGFTGKEALRFKTAPNCDQPRWRLSL